MCRVCHICHVSSPVKKSTCLSSTLVIDFNRVLIGPAICLPIRPTMAAAMNDSPSLENISTDGTPNVMIFEDTDHHNSVLENLNQLRKSKQFCDVILQVSDRYLLGVHSRAATHQLTGRSNLLSARRPTVGNSNDWIVCMTELLPS